MAAPKSRLPLYLGLTLAGAGGYYLYSAGGDPKVAEKQFEHDAARVSAKVRGELPGKEKEAQKQGEEWAQKAGARIDSTVDDAKSRIDQANKDASSKFNEYRKEAGTQLNSAVDTFDKKVEEGTSKAKSGISGWFGGK
ncbi:hypothetical protein L228DRAFT_264156 [Xylona heveae TC161]|uniref:Calcofluor white hypersensitive protein n=1 Tax=Xylona heveae (strain CBS 132557 / TC161) TaxID=1328760 RepID=A0A164ZFL6_XYLHT|nr:hypothetical protein L228DRAFT_264156 [Xylona heveae TC161]KZF19041.1 hypothetical protein L228DRAFT_264156 [Xylona heveae TC161]